MLSGTPEPKHIFITLVVEPRGRTDAGVTERIVGVLLLIPQIAAIGALGFVVGAITGNLTVLGTQENGVGELLFSLAVTITASVTLDIRRREIPIVAATFFPRN